MALVALDASVVIGFLDPDDALHASCVAAIDRHQHDDLVLPASAYAETLVAPFRAGPKAVAAVDAFLTDLGIRIEPVTPAGARAAAKLRSKRPRLRLPDALVIACAEEIGAATVLTGDARWKTASRVVRVIC